MANCCWPLSDERASSKRAFSFEREVRQVVPCHSSSYLLSLRNRRWSHAVYLAVGWLEYLQFVSLFSTRTREEMLLWEWNLEDHRTLSWTMFFTNASTSCAGLSWSPDESAEWRSCWTWPNSTSVECTRFRRSTALVQRLLAWSRHRYRRFGRWRIYCRCVFLVNEEFQRTDTYSNSGDILLPRFRFLLGIVFFSGCFAALFLVLMQSVRSIEVTDLCPSIKHSFDKPLDYRKDMDEVTTLDLMWFDGIWAFHPRENEHDSFGQRSFERKIRESVRWWTRRLIVPTVSDLVERSLGREHRCPPWSCKLEYSRPVPRLPASALHVWIRRDRSGVITLSNSDRPLIRTRK